MQGATLRIPARTCMPIFRNRWKSGILLQSASPARAGRCNFRCRDATPATPGSSPGAHPCGRAKTSLPARVRAPTARAHRGGLHQSLRHQLPDPPDLCSPTGARCPWHCRGCRPPDPVQSAGKDIDPVHVQDKTAYRGRGARHWLASSPRLWPAAQGAAAVLPVVWQRAKQPMLPMPAIPMPGHLQIPAPEPVAPAAAARPRQGDADRRRRSSRRRAGNARATMRPMQSAAAAPAGRVVQLRMRGQQP